MSDRESKDPQQSVDDAESGRKRLFDLKKLKITRGSIDGARFFLRYLRPHRLKFIAALSALFISSLAGLAFPGLIGVLVDAATRPEGSKWGTLNQVGLILIGAMLAQSAFSYLRTFFITEVAEKTLADLKHDLYDKIIHLPMKFFHTHRVGELTSRMQSDVSHIQVTITTVVSELIRQTVILVGGISLVAYTSLRLTAVILVCIPVLVVLALIFGKMLRRASKELQDLVASLNTVAEETFQGISVVKAFTAERRESDRYRSRLTEIVRLAMHVARARGAFIAFITFVLFGGVVGIVWYGGTLVAAGELSIGDLTSFVLLALFVGGALGSFPDLYSTFQSALGATERIREILLDDAEDLQTSSGAGGIRGHVELRDIHFAYPTRPDLEVLKGISLTAAAGSSIALVGASGAGKSTIAGLLMRYYEPTSGQLLVDGRDALDYPLLDHRSSIAIVPQDVALFGGTIAENIAYGRPDATAEEIHIAARLANAFDFVESFPEGFETVVGERGVQLSGGQRQRVAIARAILKDPTLLILDEATSSLDAESERLVQDALVRVMAGRTTFIIAHRLSTIRNADMIAVLSHGTITEIGSYSELIAAGGVFARLVALQDRYGADEIDETLLIE